MQSFKLLVRTALFSLAFLIAGQAHSALLIFTDRTAWQTAAGGGVGDLFEDFNSFVSDTLYGGGNPAVTAGFVTLDLVNGLNDSSYRIEVLPETFPSVPNVDGTPYATTFGYDGAPLQETDADTIMSFGNVGAIGFDYKDGSYGNANGLLTTSLGDSVSLTNVNSTDTFFLGFLYTEGEVFNSLLWGLAPGGGIGYGIGIDNVEAYSSVNLNPVPAPVLLNYDNFNAKRVNGCKYCIDSEKWIGLERGDNNTEVLREIKSKRLHMSQRTRGDMDSDTDTVQGRNRVRFRDSVNFSGACFTPRVKKYKVGNCAANLDDVSRVRVRYVGNFYDTDTADDGEDDGIVYAAIHMQRTGDSGAKKGKFRVSAFVEECEGVDCDEVAWSSEDDTNVDLDFGLIKASSNKKAMCIGYDRGNTPGEAQFVISFGNDVRVVNVADHGLPLLAGNMTPDWTWHVIETRSDIENCAAGTISGFIDADVDNVKVSEFQ